MSSLAIRGPAKEISMMTEHEKIQEMIRQKEQAPLALDPKRTALIIVDVQRFFTRPDSEFAQVFQRLAPGAIDGYFQRVNSTVLRKFENCSIASGRWACPSSSVSLARMHRTVATCRVG
jgi:hypothetical protein